MGPRHSVLVLLPDLKKSFFSKIFCWDPNETTAFLYVEMAEKNTFEWCGPKGKVVPLSWQVIWSKQLAEGGGKEALLSSGKKLKSCRKARQGRRKGEGGGQRRKEMKMM